MYGKDLVRGEMMVPVVAFVYNRAEHMKRMILCRGARELKIPRCIAFVMHRQKELHIVRLEK